MFAFKIDDDIELTLPQMHHAEELTAVVRDNLDRLRLWMPWAVEDYSLEHAKQFIWRTLDEFSQDGRFSALILYRGRIAGTIGFHHLDTTNKMASVGYWIDREMEGKGVVAKCCRVLIDYLFDTMGLNRVQINCNVENARSRAIPEKLGFTLEGTLREVEYVNGRFGDWAVYSLLKREWEAKGRASGN